MSKEEFLKIQKSVLKVNIHCDGCKHKVKKILQKIDGVFTTEIDAEQGKVTVSGNVDPTVLIKKLAKSGKHAELWGAPKLNNNHNHLANQFKNMQIDNGKGIGGGGGGGGNKGQKGGNNQPKGGGGGQQGGPNPKHLQQQLQQLQQMKGFQDLKLPPQFKLPPNQNQNQKAVKVNLPEDDDFTDDELDDEFDDDDFEDEDFDDDDEMEEPQLRLNKMKLPPMGNGPPMMLNRMNMLNAQKGANVAPVKGKKGCPGPVPILGGAVPIQVHGMSGGNGAKKGGGAGVGGGNNQNQGGSNKNNGGKNGNNGGGGNNNKNNVNNGNGGKKGGNNGMMEGYQAMNKGFPNMGGGGNMSIPMSDSMPMRQMGGTGMGNMPAVQGLPAAAMSAGAGAGAGTGGYFRGAGPDAMPGNPYQQQQQQQQQQYLAAVMNQQRAMGNERFQPMMYAPPPPAVNYMYPPPPYPNPPPPDPYSNYFSDENSSSCSVM